MSLVFMIYFGILEIVLCHWKVLAIKIETLLPYMIAFNNKIK